MYAAILIRVGNLEDLRATVLALDEKLVLLNVEREAIVHVEAPFRLAEEEAEAAEAGVAKDVLLCGDVVGKGRRLTCAACTKTFKQALTRSRSSFLLFCSPQSCQYGWHGIEQCALQISPRLRVVTRGKVLFLHRSQKQLNNHYKSKKHKAAIKKLRAELKQEQVIFSMY